MSKSEFQLSNGFYHQQQPHPCDGRQARILETSRTGGPPLQKDFFFNLPPDSDTERLLQNLSDAVKKAKCSWLQAHIVH